MKTTTAQESKTLQVPAKKDTPRFIEIMDVCQLSEKNIEMLKEEDPFMYYSIPEVRKKAGFTLKNTDQVISTSAQTSHQETTKVTRKSCIFVECYDRMIMEDDLLNDDEFVTTGNELDLLLESFLNYI